MAKLTKKTKSSKKIKWSDSAAVVFSDVQKILDDIAKGANQPISNSPHGVFWNTDRNTFVNKYVTMTCPLTSTFYVYLGNGKMPQGGPQTGQADLDVIKMWLSTGFH